MAEGNIEEIWTPEERASKLGRWLIDQKNSQQDAQSVYDDGAVQYETLVAKLGYEAPTNGTHVLLEYLECLRFKRDCRILDLGAGTGLCGRILFEAKYVNITAIDISNKMLDEANNKQVYKALIESDLNKDSLSGLEGSFDAIICVGVFFPGQVGAEALKNIPKLLKPGGIFCVTIRVEFYDDESFGYKLRCEDLIKKEEWKLIHSRKVPLLSKVGEMGYCFVFQV